MCLQRCCLRKGVCIHRYTLHLMKQSKFIYNFCSMKKTQETCRFKAMTEDRFVKSLPENAYLIV